MRLLLVVGLLAALAAPVAAEEPLVTTGELVMRKKGPGFRGAAKAAGAGDAAATFDIKQGSYGATLHREHLTEGQDVRLGGGARELELTATSRGAGGKPIETRWVLSGVAKPHKTKRAVGEHRRAGVLLVRETVEVTRKRAVHEVTTYGARGATVRREELRQKKLKGKAKRARR